MKTFIQPGKMLKLIAPYDRLSGQAAQVGSLFGVASTDVLSGAEAEFATVGVFSQAKTASQAWTQGVKLYWDNTTKLYTTSSATGTNLFVGHAVAAVAGGASDTTGLVRLHGATTI